MRIPLRRNNMGWLSAFVFWEFSSEDLQDLGISLSPSVGMIESKQVSMLGVN